MGTTLWYHISSLVFLPDYRWEDFQCCWISVEYWANKYHTPCYCTKIPTSYTSNCARLPKIEEAILLCWQQKRTVLLRPRGMNVESLEHTSKASDKHIVKREQFPSLMVFLHTELTWCWCLLLCWTLWRDWALCAFCYVPAHSTAWDRAWVPSPFTYQTYMPDN